MQCLFLCILHNPTMNKVHTMKALTVKTVTTQLNTLVRNSDESHLQTLFVNAVYHGLIHGNVMPKALASIRDSKAPAKFRAAIAKYMPAKWSKKDSKYIFDSAKRDRLLDELNLVAEKSTLAEVSNALPNAFFKAPRKSVEFNRADYLASVAKKLGDNGETHHEEVMALVSVLLDNPELITKAAKAIVNGAAKTAKAA